MAAYLKIDSIAGASTDSGHTGWIRIDSMTAPVMRSIPQGAVDQQRARGETTLGDLVVTKQVDKSSPPLFGACANGKFIPTLQLDLCSTVNGSAVPYLTYKLQNVIVTSYSLHGQADGNVLPTEEVTFAFTDISQTYIIIDPKTGANQGNVPASYSLGKTHGS